MLPHEKQVKDYEETIKRLKEQNRKKPIMSAEELAALDAKLEAFKKKVYSNLDHRIFLEWLNQKPLVLTIH